MHPVRVGLVAAVREATRSASCTAARAVCLTWAAMERRGALCEGRAGYNARVSGKFDDEEQQRHGDSHYHYPEQFRARLQLRHARTSFGGAVQ